jgi:hypothetical protein
LKKILKTQLRYAFVLKSYCTKKGKGKSTKNGQRGEDYFSRHNN